MKKFIKFLLLFTIITNCYSQSRDTIYFLINKNDTLVKKEIATKNNNYEGYQIYYNKKRKVIMNNTPVVEGKIWGEDSKYDYEVFKHVSYNFNFYRREDKIINKKYLKELNLITDRDSFLSLKRKGFNFVTLGFTYFFIEPTECDDKYIIRKAYPVTYE